MISYYVEFLKLDNTIALFAQYRYVSDTHPLTASTSGTYGTGVSCFCIPGDSSVIFLLLDKILEISCIDVIIINFIAHSDEHIDIFLVPCKIIIVRNELYKHKQGVPHILG